MVGAYMPRLFYATDAGVLQLGTILAALRLRQRSCQNPALRDCAATPRDPCADPLCRENSLRGAGWRTERQNYGLAAPRKPRGIPSLAHVWHTFGATWRFCSIHYTTARAFPRGACWRVVEAAPPREGYFRVRAAPPYVPGIAPGMPFSVSQGLRLRTKCALDSLYGARREGSHGGPQGTGLCPLAGASRSRGIPSEPRRANRGVPEMCLKRAQNVPGL